MDWFFNCLKYRSCGKGDLADCRYSMSRFFFLILLFFTACRTVLVELALSRTGTLVWERVRKTTEHSLDNHFGLWSQRSDSTFYLPSAECGVKYWSRAQDFWTLPALATILCQASWEATLMWRRLCRRFVGQCSQQHLWEVERQRVG